MEFILLVLIIGALVALIFGKETAQGVVGCIGFLVGLAITCVFLLILYLNNPRAATVCVVLLALFILGSLGNIVYLFFQVQADNNKQNKEYAAKAQALAYAKKREEHAVSQQFTICDQATNRGNVDASISALKTLQQMEHLGEVYDPAR